MTAQSKTTNKTRYETGDIPTETHFADLIDSDADAGPYIVSDPTGVTGADAVTNIISLTQAEYDAIGSPSASTFYIITDA